MGREIGDDILQLRILHRQAAETILIVDYVRVGEQTGNFLMPGTQSLQLGNERCFHLFFGMVEQRLQQTYGVVVVILQGLAEFDGGLMHEFVG